MCFQKLNPVFQMENINPKDNNEGDTTSEQSDMLFTSHQARENQAYQDLKHEFYQLKEEIVSRINKLEKEMRFEIQQIKLQNTDVKDNKYERSNSNRYGIRNFVDCSTQTSPNGNNQEHFVLSKLDYKLDNIKAFFSKKLAELDAKLKRNNEQRHYEQPYETVIRSSRSHSYEGTSTLTSSQYLSDEQNRKQRSLTLSSNYPASAPLHDEYRHERIPVTRIFTPSEPDPRFSDPWMPVTPSPSNSNFSYHPYRTSGPSFTPTSSSAKEILPLSNSVSKDIQSCREDYARKLIDTVFPYQDLADSNVTGVKGKRLLDPHKIEMIRKAIFSRYPASKHEKEDELWKLVCEKINTKCRGVTRILKRKHEQLVNSNQIFTPTFIETSEIENRSFPTFKSPDNVNLVSSESGSVSSPDSTNTVLPSDLPNTETNDENKGQQKEVLDARETANSPRKQMKLEQTYFDDVNVENDNRLSPVIKRIDTNRVLNETQTADMSDSNQNVSVNGDGDDISKTSNVTKKNAEEIIGASQLENEKNIQYSREDLCRSLIDTMFSRSTLASSNVTGARGKFMLDPGKISKVREIIFTNFPAKSIEEEETIWRILTNKINTKCRGVKRLMKRNGLLTETHDKLTNKITWTPGHILHADTGYFNLKSVTSYESKSSSLRRVSYPSLSDDSNEGKEYFPDYYYNFGEHHQSDNTETLRKTYAQELYNNLYKSTDTNDLAESQKIEQIKRTVFMKYPAKENENENLIWENISTIFEKFN